MKTITLRAILFAVFSLLLMPIKAQPPKLNSYPAAAATIFLDFDGHLVTGTLWNWAGPIAAQPSGFNDAAVKEIFNRVAEDFRPFNINITTDSTVYLAAPLKQRMRVIITPTHQWYGTSAGGVSFVDAFTFGDDTPAFVFSALLNNNVKAVAEACSHESGHTLGLQHQSSYDGNCNKTAEYNSGTGSGEIGWAPIMGNSYGRNLTTWHKGSCSIRCDSIQDDMAIIARAKNGFGYRTANANGQTASDINVGSMAQNFTVDGIITRGGERNLYKIVVPINTTLTLNAIPESVGTNNSGANLDLRVKILNSNKDTIGVYNPATLLNAGVDTSLYSGTYYLVVDGAGNANMSQYGSVGYYSIAGALATALPVREFVLRGSTANNINNLRWEYQTNEAIKELVIEGSDNGKNFQPLSVMGASATAYKTTSGQPITFYRVKAVTAAAEIAYYSNIIALSNTGQGRSVQLLGNLIADAVRVNSNSNYPYQLLDLAGKLLAKGTFQTGLNNIPVPSNTNRGLLFLRLSDGVSEWTEKLVKQ